MDNSDSCQNAAWKKIPFLSTKQSTTNVRPQCQSVLVDSSVQNVNKMVIIATIISCRSASPGLMCLLWAQLDSVLWVFGALFFLSDRLLSAPRLWIDPNRERLSAEPSSANEVIMTDTLRPESEGERSELHIRGISEDYYTFISQGCTLQDFHIKVTYWC